MNENRLKLFDELIHASENGIDGIGWPTKTWGMITSYNQIRELFAEIMHRPVWTHEMSTKGTKLMREELEHQMDTLHPIDSLKIVFSEASDK